MPRRNISLLVSLCFIAMTTSAQFTYKIKADTLLVTNDPCITGAEFNLMNSTRNIKGFLYNTGNGRTEFRRGLIRHDDTTYYIGNDTLIIPRTDGNAFIKNQSASAQTGNFWTGTGRVERMLVNVGDLGEPFQLQVGSNALFHDKIAVSKIQVADGFYKWATDYGTVTYGPSLTENAKLNITNGASGGANILLQGTQGGGGVAYNPFIFFGDNNKAYAAMRGVLRGGGNDNTQYGDIAFYTTPNVSTTTIAERMRLLSNGKFLINSTTDQGDYKFQVTGNSWSNGHALYQRVGFGEPTVRIMPDGTNPGIVQITGNSLNCPILQIDNALYAIGTGKGIIDIKADNGYMYGSDDGSGAALRFQSGGRFNGSSLYSWGTFIDMRDTVNASQTNIVGHHSKIQAVDGAGYGFYADVKIKSGGTGTPYAFYANAGQSMFKDKVTMDGPNGYSQLRLAQTYTPSASNDSNGQTGDVAWDGNYIYIKTPAGWKRSSLTSF